jgi:hypothetical protein
MYRAPLHKISAESGEKRGQLLEINQQLGTQQTPPGTFTPAAWPSQQTKAPRLRGFLV